LKKRQSVLGSSEQQPVLFPLRSLVMD